jgi:hypothetical protein
MSKIRLNNVRLSFADLFEARTFQGNDGKDSKPKFKGTFLLPKDDPQNKTIEKTIREVATAKWGAKAEAILKSINGNPNRFCYADGDTKEYDGYAGNMAITANNKVRPLVIDRDKSPLTEKDGRPYSGCYVNAQIEIFAYDNPGKGISASLSGVQFLRDGEAFSGGRPASVDDFDDVADVGEEEALV